MEKERNKNLYMQALGLHSLHLPTLKNTLYYVYSYDVSCITTVQYDVISTYTSHDDILVSTMYTYFIIYWYIIMYYSAYNVNIFYDLHFLIIHFTTLYSLESFIFLSIDGILFSRPILSR